MTHLTTRFPDDISYGSRGGPNFNTDVAQVESGHEQRNIRWEYPLHEYDVSYGVRTDQQMYTLRAFFNEAHGRGYTFDYKDWGDYKTCSPGSTTTAFDSSVGTGDASTTVFQLQKQYGQGTANEMTRKILSPVSATVSVAIGGVEISMAGVSVNYASGTIEILGGPPASSSTVTAGFEFNVPCRFNSDIFQSTFEAYNMQAADTPVIEVRRKG